MKLTTNDMHLGEKQEFKQLRCGCVLDRDPLGDPQFTFCNLHRSAVKAVETLEAVAARWDKLDDQDAPALGKRIRSVIAAARMK